VSDGRLLVVGQGLAGSCLSWELWNRNVDFHWVDRGTGGSSRVAAGMINPITGKNFEPSWRIADFLPEALEFYTRIEACLGKRFWYPLPVLRLARSEKEWGKILGKLSEPAVAPWVVGETDVTKEWVGGVIVKGGGRLDVPAFINASREFFREKGRYHEEEVVFDSIGRGRVWCEGAAGLMSGRYGMHRCAKGEILTIRANGWDETQARVGGGGWLLPVGNGIFKTGATYEWNELNDLPTSEGRAKVEEIARRLGGDDFEVIGHEAGVRPILRRSQPLIGPVGNDWMINGLGSKGSLYAPGMARRLAGWMMDGIEPEEEVDLRVFLKQNL
jgi:glycine oxidase